MSRLSRRSFITAAAAFAAAPALGAAPVTGEVDVIIIGAGAAGIAAARRVAAANRRFALIEASDRIGGRCLTDMRTFGVPFDRGAHTLFTPASNPLAKVADSIGVDIHPAPRLQKLRVGPRAAREGELEDFLATQVRSARAIADAARGKVDPPAAQALPKDLGDWRATAEFVLGPWTCGKDLQQVSSVDFTRGAEREAMAYCRDGLGTLLARLASNLSPRLSTPATKIEWLKTVEVETEQGRLRGQTIIVTASTGVLASGKIKFTPELPERHARAISALALGSEDHIALELPGNPLGLQPDDLVFEKASSARTAALLARVSGSDVHVLKVGGAFGRDLAAQGQDAMVAFALEWLASVFGDAVKAKLKRSAATNWSREPWALGAASVAWPGDQDARRAMMSPIRERVFFAGEAVHETLWGTVGGAWESGTRAAEAALRKIGAIKDPEKEKKTKEKPAPRRRRRRDEDE
ncbi:MAG TPA: NAD(P)/FAD-dependent oxidoreductase [Pseudolabrys sp.]|nr:NAD(P)/FAD-dependent oxidoreductase [Pseudolabrys sp.]